MAYLVLGLIVIVYLFNGIQYLRSQSLTSDEGTFYDYAKRYLRGNPSRIYPRSDNSKMPVVVLNTIPRVIEQALHPGLKKNDWGLSDIMGGRYVTLFISVLTILLVFTWAKQLYGFGAGLFAAFLMSWCPNNLANAALVTTDSYSVLFLLATMYSLWRFCLNPAFSNILILSIMIGLSQLVKQSLFHLYVLIPLCLLLFYFVSKPGINLKRLIIYSSLFIIVNWFIINAGYYFYQANLPLAEYRFMSRLFQSIQLGLPSWLVVPVPKPFLDGLDMAKYYDQVGGGFDGISSFGSVTILGEKSTGGSFWYYYFASLLFKTPITYLLLLLTALIVLIRQRTGVAFMKKEFFLLMPVFYFLFLFSFLYNTQCGLRHLVFIFPLLFILSALVVTITKTTVGKVAVVSSGIYLVISVLLYWRNYYPYTNELISQKQNAYAYVGAANLEFKQAKYFFNDYLEKHPGVKPAPLKPRQGTFLVTSDDYLDVWNRNDYNWIQRYKPFGHVAFNGLLIKVSAHDLEAPR
ncbi:phospholipid carrier-dependent glycosyltransferase [Segetibacter sp. 3557_3]|uniref:ArnT family glycosyltransferase n=1 Tax=Segetibacter sp. 3557_3 TaxID=2547429 RepID=UPI0010588C94|nr:glycosyltransferase family 39 protein [Segetibacter sp. 3557_3]TDH17930.1 phospholipid carrier-dependent glycosyltransferase [Segetibacter sp. 3557_3]